MSNQKTIVNFIADEPEAADVLRHKLIAQLFDLPIWYRGKERVVTPGWNSTLTVEERDILAAALQQWKPE